MPAAPCYRLSAYGVGRSLVCYRSIRFAPVRGSTYFLCLRKESRRRKRAHTADWLVGVHPCPQPGTAQDETCRRTPRVSEKAVIRSGVALCAPRSGTTLSACSTGCLRLLGRGFFQNRIARRFPPHLANPPPETNAAFRDRRCHVVGQPRSSGALRASPARVC